MYIQTELDLTRLDNIEEEQKRQFEYYKSSMEQEITISNSVILNNLLK